MTRGVVTAVKTVEAAARMAEAKRKRDDQVARVERELKKARRRRRTHERSSANYGRSSSVVSTPSERQIVTISNGDELARVVGENAVGDIPETKYADVIALIPQMSDELRAELFKIIPGLLQFSLDAMQATEDTLKTTLAANAQDQAELSASFSELQAIAKGRLERDGMSEEHEQFLLDYLMKLQDRRIESSRENKQFIANEAAAARRAKMVQSSMPVLEMAIMAGVRIMLTRGR